MSATLCLGEAVVDFIAERPVGRAADADRFVPHLGGTSAAVAAHAARAGGRVALGGAAGDDRWGRWLREQLGAEGVAVDRFHLLADVSTQLAFVTVDDRAVPTYEPYEPLTDAIAAALGDDVRTAVDDASGLFLGSHTLAGAVERELTMRARERALETETPVILDGSLRLDRWSSRADAAASINACVPGAVLVRVDRADAELLTGEPDPQRAALALRKAGAEVVVVTLGAGGALLRAANRLSLDLVAPAVAPLRSTVGAAAALTGTLLAALERSGYYPDAAAAALDDALAAAARACTHWGALD